MKAAVIDDFKGLDHIEIREEARRKPQDNEVEIEVRAAGVNPVDWKIAEGFLKNWMEYTWPITLGWECAGLIADPGSSSFKKGDRVYAYCRKERIHEGSFAQYICLDADKVSFMPKNLSFEEAAATPLSALTAWQSLVDRAQLKAGQTVLIHAGAGGVGSFAIQIAKQLGCFVITTARPVNHTYCALLGADLVIDYTQPEALAAVKQRFPDGLDCIYNTVSPDLDQQQASLLKKGGWLISIVGAVDQQLAEKHGIRADFVFVEPNKKELDEITRWLEKGRLKPPAIQQVFALDKVEEALKLSRKRHVQGKLVITLDQST